MERCTVLRGECHDAGCYVDTPHACHDILCTTKRLREQLADAQATIAALQGQVRELEARCQRAPLDHETVCHACDGSGWVERGY